MSEHKRTIIYDPRNELTKENLQLLSMIPEHTLKLLFKRKRKYGTNQIISEKKIRSLLK